MNLVSIFLFSQTPNQFKYQAVLRNSDGTLMAEERVTIAISILKSDLITSVFEETHSITTTSQGLINLNIGSKEDLSSINWNIDKYFIEISINGTVIGTNQLLSVPYALQAKTAESVTGPITETDPAFSAWDKSTGISITESQISDLDHFSSADETDPVFDASIANGISSTDTAYWNDKSEFDGNFSNLTNAPDIANTSIEKRIHLNTNDNTSSFNITKDNDTNVFKVDASGRITGDGSALSNVKPLINYIGGNQRYQITSNYGSYNNVRSVTLTVPSSGVCFVMASGYVDWESINWDVILLGILCDQDPNNSWNAENEWYSYLNILTDYNCADSSDQYTSFSQHRCIPVGQGTHTFYLWANKYSTSSKVEVGDVNLSVMFFPTGGIGKSTNDAIIKEDKPVIKVERVPNTVAGYK